MKQNHPGCIGCGGYEALFLVSAPPSLRLPDRPENCRPGPWRRKGKDLPIPELFSRIRQNPLRNRTGGKIRPFMKENFRNPDSPARMGRSPLVRPAVYFPGNLPHWSRNGRHRLDARRGHVLVRSEGPTRMNRMTRPPANPRGIPGPPCRTLASVT